MRIKYKAHPTKRPLAHLIPPPKPGRSLRTEAAVKSKETVGNSWTVLKVILGHRYHHNH